MEIESLRRQFPALSRVQDGRPVAYFDAPGGTQVPRAVAEAMTDYLFHHNANTHWAYPTSAETDAMIEAARVAAEKANGGVRCTAAPRRAPASLPLATCL